VEDIQIMIDLSGLDPNLPLDRLEKLTLGVADEIREGKLVNKTELVREDEIPEGGKPALAGFVLGLLKTEISVANIQALLNYLGERFYGKDLKLEYEDKKTGTRVSIDCTDRQLEQVLQAVERISKLKVLVQAE
jgi:hypothetical protein